MPSYDIIQQEYNQNTYSNSSTSGLKDESFRKSNVLNIIGLPPAAYEESQYSTNKVFASIPVLRLYPACPKMRETGIKLYGLDLDKGGEEYKKIVTICGFKPSIPLHIAFINEGPISESWTNDYAESMFEEIGGLAARPLRELQAIGYESPAEAIGAVKDYFGGITKTGLTGALANLGGFVAGAAEKITQKIQSFSNKAIQNIIMGSNIDFPMIWGGSNYQPNYSILVRLVNRYPQDENEYLSRIVEPLVKLLALGIPISDSESTYTYPLLCKVYCPGLFSLDAGYIASIEVTKGNDGMDIGFHQRPGTVDVRISFGSLYNSMISLDPEHSGGSDLARPTLDKYVHNLRSKVDFPNPYSIPTIPNPNEENIVIQSEEVPSITDSTQQVTPKENGGEESTQTRIPTDEEKQAAEDLNAENPSSTTDGVNVLTDEFGNPMYIPTQEDINNAHAQGSTYTDEYIKENSTIVREYTGDLYSSYTETLYFKDKNGHVIEIPKTSPLGQRINQNAPLEATWYNGTVSHGEMVEIRNREAQEMRAWLTEQAKIPQQIQAEQIRKASESPQYNYSD